MPLWNIQYFNALKFSRKKINIFFMAVFIYVENIGSLLHLLV